MTNWQKQVNSQLRLTPLFQPILVDYQSNFRYRGESGRKRQNWDTPRYGNHISLGDPGSSTSSLWFWQPHHCRYVCDSCWGKALETPTNQAPFRPPIQTEVSLLRRSRHRLWVWECQDQVPETTGVWRALCSRPPQAQAGIRAIKIFPWMSVPEDISHVRLLFLAILPHNPKGRQPLTPHSISAFKPARSPTDSSFFTVFKLQLN